MGNKSSKKVKDKQDRDKAGNALDGGIAGTKAQNKFSTIPPEHLNKETVAGIVDNSLGRVKDGKPVGAPIIRFDTGHTSGANPHINIDPTGRPSALNPHIEVYPQLINAANLINKCIMKAGVKITAAAIAIDVYRINSAFRQDEYIAEHADQIIKELETAIPKLKAALERESDPAKRNEIDITLQHFQNCLRDVKRTKTVPVETIKTTLEAVGGWAGGFAGGAAGALAGAEAGALIGGAICGPPCAAVGAVGGAVAGAIGGGVAGGIGGGAAGGTIAEQALKVVDD